MCVWNGKYSQNSAACFWSSSQYLSRFVYHAGLQSVINILLSLEQGGRLQKSPAWQICNLGLDWNHCGLVTWYYVIESSGNDVSDYSKLNVSVVSRIYIVLIGHAYLYRRYIWYVLIQIPVHLMNNLICVEINDLLLYIWRQRMRYMW